MNYRVALAESDEGFAIWVPALPGCCSQGKTEEEALMNIQIAIREYVEVAAEKANDWDVEIVYRDLEVAM
ncbi:type II toxin-antitoxin system HicB family antitoxin [Stratiformator vulcanicus]|uniref:HicB-like antitoxin of toxin-antitoxin system domain-containing protein n=1 Tax=Stratiformator vulcanicus TaxID=2527980 RepID=A0A517QXB0_9PLAN|nr:type II toxin-antitoxin system HicB family antitoxin [Stratiformator vulcanicus]QDT36223.1 hypothetical protein Pan189_05780 [Stratiformator vulcanicus]